MLKTLYGVVLSFPLCQIFRSRPLVISPQATAKLSSLLAVSILLMMLLLAVGCSRKHGFEGEYTLEHTSGIDSMDEVIELFRGLITPGESPIIVIGPDYFDVDGRRTAYDRIFVRESGRHRYLVFQQGNEETIWKVEDGGQRLEQKAGFIQLTLLRMDSSPKNSEDTSSMKTR